MATCFARLLNELDEQIKEELPDGEEVAHGLGSNEPYRNNYNDIRFDHYERDHSSPRSSPIWRRIKREAQCTLKTFVDILTGRASKFTYVLAPVLFALFWVLICIITGSRSVSLHDRLVQSKRVS